MIKIIPLLLVGLLLFSLLGSVLSGSGGTLATILTIPMTATDDSMTVTSTTGFDSQGIVDVQNEKILYGGKTATTFTLLTRGWENTTASAHPIIANGLRTKVYTEDAGALNRALGFNVGAVMATSGTMATFIVPWYFFTKTLPHLMMWDCLFFFEGSPLIYIKYIAMIVTFAVVVVFAIQIGGVLSSALQKVISSFT